MKLKTIAMIPVLLGSQRIKDKNLILVNGRPLPSYAIEACKQSGAFDDIYLNSEHTIFKKLAKMHGIKFFKRFSKRGGSACTMKNKSRDCKGRRCQVHDHFISDFLKKVKADLIFQVHTTSPLLKPETIKQFVKTMKKGNYDSFFAVHEQYTETFLDNKPVNFNISKKSPTQLLNALQIISWSITGWKAKSFLNSYKDNDVNDSGPTFVGKMNLFPINKIEALDIDDWDDLFIAEACLAFQIRRNDKKRFYLSKDIIEIDSDVVRLIKRDGVPRFNLKGYNKLHNSFAKIKKQMGKAPWTYPVVYTDRDQICLIAQHPGESCRNHYHVTKDEWWLVVEGEFEWRLKNRVIKAKKGDLIILKKGTVHKIICTSKTPGIRLAGGGRDMDHIYVKEK